MVLVVGVTNVMAAVAQDAPVATQSKLDELVHAFPQGMTAEQIDAVLGVMGDAELRGALRERLLAEIAAGRAAAAVAASEPTLLEYYRLRLAAVGATYSQLPRMIADSFYRPRGQGIPMSPGRLAALILISLAAGIILMVLVRLLLATRRRQLIDSAEVGRGGRTGPLLLRLLLDLIEIAAFLGGIVAAYVLLRPSHPVAPAILMIVLRAVLAVLVVDKVGRLICDPSEGGSRLLPVSSETARFLHRVVLSIALLSVVVAGISQTFIAVGMPRDGVLAFALPASLAPFAYLLAILWLRRAWITAAIGRWLQLPASRMPLLNAWPALATAYLVGLWLVIVHAALHGQPTVGMKALASLLLVLAVPAVAWLIHRPIARFYGLAPASDGRPVAHFDGRSLPVTDEYGDALPAAGASAGTVPSVEGVQYHIDRLMRAVWIVLIVLAVLVTARIWGFDPERHVGVGGFVIRLLFDIGVVLLIGYVGWALIVRWIDRALENARREGRRSPRALRIATLLPLLRKFLKVVLFLIVAMIVLSSIGIDIGPLLAGAGVAGLAIGLGAQQTIADIVAGVFFLVEDAFHVGDYVEAGSVKGTVESISLRSLKLRHHRGAVHTLPFGQIKSLTNYTRDWALIRLEFRVAPETDLALVKKLVKEIGKELAADPGMGPNFIEPLKSQGIRNVEDGALIIGIKYIARPGQQFVIRREAYRRIIDAFRKHGIELVGRGVVVKVEGPEDVPGAAVGAAAQAVRGAS